MIYLVSTLSILLFIIFFLLLKIVTVAKQAINTCNMAMATLTNADLEDEEKEVIIQRASISLLKSFISILFRSLISMAVSIVPILIFDQLDYVKMEETYSFLSRWDVIIVASLIVTLLYLVIQVYLSTRARICPSK